MIEKLFLEYGYKDYQHHVQSVNSRKLAEQFERNFLQEELNYVVEENGSIRGAASLKDFPTLSNIWKKKTVFLKDFVCKNHCSDTYYSLIKGIVKKYSSRVDFMITKQPVDNNGAINALAKYGFYYVCGEMIYTLALNRLKNKLKLNQDQFEYIRLACLDDLPLIKKLAHKHNKYNRYLCDRKFKESHIGKLYEKVIEQSFANKNHSIYIYEKEGEVYGFITTINNKVFSQMMEGSYASLDYITVNESFRKKGVGKALTNYGLKKLMDDGAEYISVKTMSNNYPAIKLLIKNQFIPTSQNLIYHCELDSK